MWKCFISQWGRSCRSFLKWSKLIKLYAYKLEIVLYINYALSNLNLLPPKWNTYWRLKMYRYIHIDMEVYIYIHTHTHTGKYTSHWIFFVSIYLIIWFLWMSSVQFSSVTQLFPILCNPVDCSTREGNGTPLQYSCLENPMDGGAW